MRKHFAIAAIVAVLAGPGMPEAATAEPQAGEVLALFGQCFVETAERRHWPSLGLGTVSTLSAPWMRNGVVGTTIFEESGSHMTRWWREMDSTIGPL